MWETVRRASVFGDDLVSKSDNLNFPLYYVHFPLGSGMFLVSIRQGYGYSVHKVQGYGSWVFTFEIRSEDAHQSSV